eukprot:361107-Chlamydomonas_euryale.AAC.3
MLCERCQMLCGPDVERRRSMHALRMHVCASQAAKHLPRKHCCRASPSVTRATPLCPTHCSRCAALPHFASLCSHSLQSLRCTAPLCLTLLPLTAVIASLCTYPLQPLTPFVPIHYNACPFFHPD